MSIGVDVLGFLGKAIDKIVPDASDRQKLKIRMLELEQKGEFRELDLAFGAIMAEANSKDPWTSRARPAFLYVMYFFILFAIPMGILSVFQPTAATAIAAGTKAWLASIPDPMWALFGAGYLGYVKKRSDDKMTMAGIEPKKLFGVF